MSTTATGPAEALHWSFNQDHSRDQPGFGAVLRATLRQYYAGRAAPGRSSYRVLPNFWSGYQHPRPPEPALGSLEITRRAAANGEPAAYRVTAANGASGEHASYTFSAAADRWRSLTGSWQVEVRNDSGDAYRRYAAAGALEAPAANGERRVRLQVNGAALPAGTWSGARPLTTPWALLDVVPELQDGCELALLEDLDRLREPVRVTPVGTWRWPPPDADLGVLSGWCAHGPGLLPTYYWVDRGGAVVVASGLFQTWVAGAPPAAEEEAA